MRIRFFRCATYAKMRSRRDCRCYRCRSMVLCSCSSLCVLFTPGVSSTALDSLLNASRCGKRLREGEATSLPLRPIRRGRPEPTQRTHRGSRALRRRMRSPRQNPRCCRQSQPDEDVRRGRRIRRRSAMATASAIATLRRRLRGRLCAIAAVCVGAAAAGIFTASHFVRPIMRMRAHSERARFCCASMAPTARVFCDGAGD